MCQTLIFWQDVIRLKNAIKSPSLMAGMYVMVAGQLRSIGSPDQCASIRVLKIADLSNNPHSEALWMMEVVDAQSGIRQTWERFLRTHFPVFFFFISLVKGLYVTCDLNKHDPVMRENSSTVALISCEWWTVQQVTCLFWKAWCGNQVKTFVKSYLINGNT